MAVSSSPVGSQSSNSHVSEVLESGNLKTTGYIFGSKVTIGISLVKMWYI
jgi:hypothetical protein